MTHVALDPISITDRRSGFDQRRGVGIRPAAARLTRLVEEGVELVEFLLRDRVVFMIMTLRTFHGQPHEDRGYRVDLIDVISHAIFLGDRSALVRVHAVAQKPRSNALLLGSARQQITSDLFDRELVEALVGEESMNYPVAPDPHVTMVIDRVTVGIRIARAVEPIDRKPFSSRGRRKQPLNHSLVRIRFLISQESINLLRRRGQSG